MKFVVYAGKQTEKIFFNNDGKIYTVFQKLRNKLKTDDNSKSIQENGTKVGDDFYCTTWNFLTEENVSNKINNLWQQQ